MRIKYIRMKYKNKISDKDFAQIVAISYSIAQVIKNCNLIPAGGNYKTIKDRIKDLNLDITHFTGQGWNVGLKFIPKPRQPLYKILVKESTYSSYKLLKRLIKEGLKTHQCEICKNIKWCNNLIPIELHHVNGNNKDNRIENLQVLCPNCHAQTSNYRGKNKKS